MINQSHPEKEEREAGSAALSKTFPCDEELRGRLRALRAAGQITNAKLVKGTRVNETIVSQYLNDDGNLYPGEIEKYEARLASWLDRRELEALDNIPTIATPVSDQIASAAKMIRRCRIMGKGIGKAGIGKTRGSILLQAEDETAVLLFVSRETGTREAIRSAVLKKLGIRGPRKRTANRKRLMYSQLVNKLRGSDILLILDQAHKLTGPAIDFLVELWNDTHVPQLWLGTHDLIDKLARDEQWASRLSFTVNLAVQVDRAKDINEVRALVQHQIDSRLPQASAEKKQLATLCEKLALTGSFRRVEMQLTTMLYLSESPKTKGKTWCELFDLAGEFLPYTESDN